ncbi:hypothetical protein Mnod_8777 (plasmid) [Methylobacterium nodulans ORS 2060]|uniref:Uncharacterized protein n=1 Tax=Methylobacterium nodulans (strain LMG 21967 / CNCM I-2342 / ORS 2060) TaxID=460265 RepID=B8IXU8_METNO|nr:hypothetical protein Mnod_8777 [Methylobacterium nodulans ORS 2060]
MSLASMLRARIADWRQAQARQPNRIAIAALRLLNDVSAGRSLSGQELIAMARAARAQTSWH